MEKRRNGNLPQELVLDILLRLPVKVLSRCKCVSKNWCGLIASPSFVKQHFECNQERLLIRLGKPNQEGNGSAMDVDEVVSEPEEPYHQQMPDQEGIDVDHAFFSGEMAAEYEEEQILDQEGYKYALYVDETFSEYEEPLHLQIPDEASDVFGPLNGVFCVVTQFHWGPMALLNPALRQFKPLPLVQRMDSPNTSFFHNELGLGLDPLTGDYKLVFILYFLDMNMSEQEYHCIVSVCTSDSDSWRVLEDVDSIILNRSARKSLCNTYLNGAYYWLLGSNDTTDVAILAFDMGTDKFREIQVTGCVDQSEGGHLALCGDSLALLMNGGEDRCIDVWLMVNEGCWIKTSRIGPLEGIRCPLCFWRNNELLLETMTAFLTQCNVSTQELKTFEARRTDQCFFSHWVYVYKESLVSIKGEAVKCKLWDPSSDFIKDFFKDSSSEKVPIVV